MQQTKKTNMTMNVMIPILLVGVIIIMVIPIPAGLLDILLSLNITLSLVILFVSIHIARPLEFSSYPALLLITTLFRLAMNISSTRLVLLKGHTGMDAAGHVIQAFGNFVVGGSYVVGIIIFTIITLVNFLVINKGAVRIAEVAARFTLDAMPGKQMAIDSDLNAGIITEKEAKKIRKELNSEAEFHGAMDGASKFVRGDAIAGIVITLINIIGGLIIGVALQGLEWSSALQTYTMLTIGDGLVSQIPALIVSVSAGLIVARASTGSDLGTEVTAQITRFNKPLWLSSGAALVFAIIPGLPFLPFISLSILAACLAHVAGKKNLLEHALEDDRQTAETANAPTAPIPGSTEEVKSLLGVNLLELEVGYELIPLIDTSSGGELINRIRGLRRQFAIDLGFIVPSINIKDNLRLEPTQYRFLLKGVPIAKANVMPNHYLAIDYGNTQSEINGIATKEPAFGLDALWIAATDKERAMRAGYEIIDPTTVITTHLTEIIKAHAGEILGRQETQILLDNLAKAYPKLVEEVVPGILPLGTVQQVLSGLLSEGVSIKDLRTIMEILADYGLSIKSSDRLIEYVRLALARAITSRYLLDDRVLPLANLNPMLEKTLNDGLHVTEQGVYLALEPSLAQRLIQSLKTLKEKFKQNGLTPILLCSGRLRSPLYAFVQAHVPDFRIISHQELMANSAIQVQSMGMVEAE
jgi:flagellar biosynthesis protein FlhA